MNDDKFCRKCGKERTKKVLERGFNPTTGERNFSMECPDHDAVDCVHNHNYRPAKFFSFSMADEKCTKCGDEVIYPCY